MNDISKELMMRYIFWPIELGKYIFNGLQKSVMVKYEEYGF